MFVLDKSEASRSAFAGDTELEIIDVDVGVDLATIIVDVA